MRAADFGYQERDELDARPATARSYGLAPKERMRDLDDPARPAVNDLSHDADWIDFDATRLHRPPTRSRSRPGYLQREWTENGRRYFHYKMDAPILNFFAFLSARYAVKRDVWHGPAGDVAHRDLLPARPRVRPRRG